MLVPIPEPGEACYQARLELTGLTSSEPQHLGVLVAPEHMMELFPFESQRDVNEQVKGVTHLACGRFTRGTHIEVLEVLHATALIAAGEHVKVVSERLGHYSSAFTLDTYASVLKGMQRDAVERLASVVAPRIGDG